MLCILTAKSPFLRLTRSFATPRRRRIPAKPMKLEKSEETATKLGLAEALGENPEYFQAVPKNRKLALFTDNDGPSKDEGLDMRPKEPELPAAHQGNYFDSLSYKRKEMLEKEAYEKVRENEMQFIDGYIKPERTVKKLMSEKQIEEVHLELDKRMQELEDTGLSRGDILGKTGTNEVFFPLKEDPVFQLVKTNRTVREMLIHSDEVFSAENVIEKTLEQNLGPDPSIANVHTKYIDRSKLTDNQIIHQKQFFNKKSWPIFESEDINYLSSYREKKATQKMFTREKPPTFRTIPLSRKVRRRITWRNIKRSEVTWDNCSLLTQFMNPAGRLYNRLQSHLKTFMHKRVRRAISASRWIGLLPSNGAVRPCDKFNLKPLIEEVHKFDLRTIDARSGILIFRDPQYTYADMVTKGTNMTSYNESKPEFVKEFALDRDVKAPAFEEVIWKKAQKHLKQEKDLTPPEAEAREKAFKYAEKLVKKVELEKSVEAFLQEKNLNHKYFEKAEELDKDIIVEKTDLHQATKRIRSMWEKYYPGDKGPLSLH